jgi:hypothetical protein
VKRRLFVPMIALGAVLVVVLAYEIFLHLVDAQVPHPALYPGERVAPQDAGSDPAIGWKLPLSTVLNEVPEDYEISYRSNEAGFRNDHELSEETDRRKVVFLGDSFTFGSGVEVEPEGQGGRHDEERR